MVITDLTYRCSRLLTQSGKLQIHSYQYLKPVIYDYIQKKLPHRRNHAPVVKLSPRVVRFVKFHHVDVKMSQNGL